MEQAAATLAGRRRSGLCSQNVPILMDSGTVTSVWLTTASIKTGPSCARELGQADQGYQRPDPPIHSLFRPGVTAGMIAKLPIAVASSS